MPDRTIAIGDIHGCARALTTLLSAVEPSAQDRLIPLGDFIDRGPASREVMDCLIALADRCELIPIMGNHELMLLAAREDEEDLEFWRTCGGEQTLDSYGGSLDDIPDEHIKFIEGCRPYFEDEACLFLHANYAPDLTLEQHSDYPLFWQHLGRTAPPPHKSGKTAWVGHTPQVSGEFRDCGHLVCIDTYCFGGGWLTAVDVNTRQLWQANQAGQLRTVQASCPPPPAPER